MKKLKGRLKGCFLGALVVVGLLALVVFVGRASFRRVGDRQLAAVTAKIDADDPGWRLTDIEDARAKAAPPDADNPARVAIALHARLPKKWDESLADTGLGPVWADHPSFWEFVALVGIQAAAADVPATARDELFRPAVFAQPHGHFRLEHKDNPFATLLPDVQNLRSIFTLLEVDARMAVLGGDPTRAVRDARAILVAVRALGDEPFLISQLVRMAGCGVACRTTMQVLAWGEPTDGLAELQAELLAEAAHPGYLLGLRGERAMVDKLFDGLQSGKLTFSDLNGLGGSNSTGAAGLLHQAGFAAYKGFLPGDRAEALRVLTEHIAAAKLPLHEQKAAIAAVQLPPRPPESFRYLVTRLCLPAVDKIHEAYLRTRGELRTAAVAVACERFRKKNGRWPETLAEIPKDILPDLPTDPYTGGPLGYKGADDGVAVTFTAAEEKRLNPFGLVRLEPDPMEGLGGRGWRLWGAGERGTTRPAPDRDFQPEMAAAKDEADPPWTGRVVTLVERRTREVLLPRDVADYLRTQARAVVDVQPGFARGAYRLTPRGFVGALSAPGVRFDIRAKLPWPNLLMLLGLADRPFAAADRLEPAARLLDTLAGELANRLRAVARAGLVGGYGEADRQSPFLRGRLRAADQLRDAAARAFPDRFHVTEDVFDLDTPWNRIPKAMAVDSLARPDLSPGVRDALAAAAVPFADVPAGPATDADFAAAAREPRAAAYNALLDLCRLIRDGLASADPVTSGPGGLLIDLGRAFERHLTATAIAAVGTRPGWAVDDQPRYAVGFVGGRPVELQPDLVVRRRGEVRAVLDAKWKRVGPDPADLHQVLAYATLTGARHVGLVYPGRSPGRKRLVVCGRVVVSLVRLPVAGPVDSCHESGVRLLSGVLRTRPPHA